MTVVDRGLEVEEMRMRPLSHSSVTKTSNTVVSVIAKVSSKMRPTMDSSHTPDQTESAKVGEHRATAIRNKGKRKDPAKPKTKNPPRPKVQKVLLRPQRASYSRRSPLRSPRDRMKGAR